MQFRPTGLGARPVWKDQYHENCPSKARSGANSLAARFAYGETFGQLFSSRCHCKQATAPRSGTAANLIFDDKRLASARLVEPDGIEPTTSCLQSRRSPN